jgi:hypothetical protein
MHSVASGISFLKKTAPEIVAAFESSSGEKPPVTMAASGQELEVALETFYRTVTSNYTGAYNASGRYHG